MADASTFTKGLLYQPSLQRKIAALFTMLALLWVFRSLAAVFVVFFLFSRAFKWSAVKIGAIFGGRQRIGLVISIVLFLGLLSGAVWGIFYFGISLSQKFPIDTSPESIFTYLRDMKVELAAKLPSFIPVDSVLDGATHYAKEFFRSHGASFASGFGRNLVYVVIGIIVAWIYLFDEEKVDQLLHSLHPERFFGVLQQYFRFWGEAILITVKLQVIVAVVNTILTIPVLLILQLPRLGFLIVIIFLSSLIPILGNFISGAILVVFSYLHKGVFGVVIFLAITAVLHKIEAYYLNPRLSSKHVQLPTLFLIFSLIAFEYLLGIVGIFLSFPCLYVGIKISHMIKHSIREIQTHENR